MREVPQSEIDAADAAASARARVSMGRRLARIAAVCLLLGPVAYFIVGPVLLTTVQAQQMAFAIDAAEHPPSVLVETFQWVGVAGNGNHCDFTVGQLRLSELPEAQVRDEYDGVSVETIGHVSLDLQVAVGAEILRAGYGRHTPRLTALLEEFRTNQSAYVIYAQYSRAPAGDFRCH